MGKTRAGIRSFEVGYMLLEALARAHGPLMLRDLAAAAGMSAAKAYRYLVSYHRLGLVSQDAASARYDPGPPALRMGLAAITRLDAVRLARPRSLGRKDLPRNQSELQTPLTEVRRHGMARVADTPLPGIAGFCGSVFGFDDHMALGMVTMGSVATFDTAWNGKLATALGLAARQLSRDLGHAG
ncbi:MAG: helix-turn-helix domain-containing protein [Curvibacter sp.]|jgi:DNA-binding IclR family transcriptional regulator|nr:helix-turn-helix domain-containing protein [Curvibacter sp.]